MSEPNIPLKPLINPWHQSLCLVHLTIAMHVFLYLVVSQEMIGMILVQVDDEIQENVIYYFSLNIIDAKISYRTSRSEPYQIFM